MRDVVAFMAHTLEAVPDAEKVRMEAEEYRPYSLASAVDFLAYMGYFLEPGTDS
jgi:hypothetical protein